MPRMPDPIYFTTKTQRHRGWIDPLFLVSAFRLFVPIRVIRAIPACRRPGAGRRGKTPRLGSDPRSISPRITRISRMQRCSSHATVAKPQRLPAALSSSLFARDADASGAKLAKAQRKAFSLPLLSAKSVQSAVKLRSPFSGLRFSSCALCVPCAA
jgi:hypothetical protein